MNNQQVDQQAVQQVAQPAIQLNNNNVIKSGPDGRYIVMLNKLAQDISAVSIKTPDNITYTLVKNNDDTYKATYSKTDVHTLAGNAFKSGTKGVGDVFKSGATGAYDIAKSGATGAYDIAKSGATGALSLAKSGANSVLNRGAVPVVAEDKADDAEDKADDADVVRIGGTLNQKRNKSSNKTINKSSNKSSNKSKRNKSKRKFRRTR